MARLFINYKLGKTNYAFSGRQPLLKGDGWGLDTAYTDIATAGREWKGCLRQNQPQQTTVRQMIAGL